MTVKFQARGNRGEIWLYDQIGASFWGDGITAKSFQKDLQAMGKVTGIDLRINSPGGDVFEGFAIYNQLVQHPATVDVYVDGVAASISSIIAMAGNKISMAKNSMMMIHNPQGSAYGDEREMDRVKALLQQVKANLTTTYVDRTGNDAKSIEAWMDDETWFTADSALENGFADVVIEGQAVNACFDLSPFRNVPQALRDQMSQITASTPDQDILRARVNRLHAAADAVRQNRFDREFAGMTDDGRRVLLAHGVACVEDLREALPALKAMQNCSPQTFGEIRGWLSARSV